MCLCARGDGLAVQPAVLNDVIPWLCCKFLCLSLQGVYAQASTRPTGFDLRARLQEAGRALGRPRFLKLLEMAARSYILALLLTLGGEKKYRPVIRFSFFFF